MNEFDHFIENEYQKYDKSIILEKNNSEFDKHFKKWNFFDFKKTLNVDLNKPGQVFLYEVVMDDYRLHYPKIGIFINYIPCDQTVELEWMDVRRTWEYRRKFLYNFKDGSYHNSEREYSFCYLSSKHLIRSIPQWNDTHLIYGVWDTLPNWKVLKKYYENTWWFHRKIDEKRNISIDRILK